jgi:hypothetical protein
MRSQPTPLAKMSKVMIAVFYLVLLVSVLLVAFGIVVPKV